MQWASACVHSPAQGVRAAAGCKQRNGAPRGWNRTGDWVARGSPSAGWQLTATVFALLALEAFLLFWIDGVAGNPPVGLARWTQVLVGGVLWPPVMAIMDRIRERLEKRDTSFS